MHLSPAATEDAIRLLDRRQAGVELAEKFGDILDTRAAMPEVDDEKSVCWSGLRGSNPSNWLGKPGHYHYAKPASETLAGDANPIDSRLADSSRRCRIRNPPRPSANRATGEGSGQSAVASQQFALHDARGRTIAAVSFERPGPGLTSSLAGICAAV